MQEDIPMGVSSTVAREKARQPDFMLKELASKIDDVRLDIDNVRLDIRASGPRLTLCGIPDEIILQILQLGFTLTHFQTIVNMSLVCKQFRCIVLSSSNLWAACTLTLHMPPHIIDMVVSRSGSNGIAVELMDRPRPSQELLISSLTKLFEHRSRWRELEIELSDETLQLILAHFRNAYLSALVSLSNNSFFPIYQDWMLPSLRVLVDGEWTPPLSFANRVPNLIKCCLESTPSEFSELFSFLNAIPRLEELQLKIYDENTLVQSTTLHLPALKTLILRFRSESKHGALVEHTLRLFSCPEVKQFSLFLNKGGDETLDSIILGWRRALPSLRSLCPCLESISLSLFNFRTREKMYFIDDVLQNFPRTIENIHLNIWFGLLLSHYHDSLPQASKSTHPCLTSLIIEHRNSMDEDFFAQVAAQLKLRNIRLKKISNIRQRKEVKKTRNVFREAGVLYDVNVPQ